MGAGGYGKGREKAADKAANKKLQRTHLTPSFRLAYVVPVAVVAVEVWAASNRGRPAPELAVVVGWVVFSGYAPVIGGPVPGGPECCSRPTNSRLRNFA